VHKAWILKPLLLAVPMFLHVHLLLSTEVLCVRTAGSAA
jgi:hypothetical protein